MSMKPAFNLRLVGDVGGTNVRFALADVSSPTPRLFGAESFLVADFPGLEAAIAHYLDRAAARPHTAVVAVAGPVDRGEVSLTNGRWRMSETALTACGFGAARLINDYTALALAVGHLSPDDLDPIGPDQAGRGDATVAVLGAGTGLGVAALVRSGAGEAVATTEGGHIAFAPFDELEIEVLRQLTARFGRVSLERILSGSGLTDLRWALGRIDGGDPEPLPPEQIVSLARSGRDPLCARTLERFCAIYGGAAGDIALVLGARGGIYLGGGIAPRILGELRAGAFRARFEAKGRFAGYMAAIPTRVIRHPYAALLGAAEALQTPGATAAAAIHVA